MLRYVSPRIMTEKRIMTKKRVIPFIGVIALLVAATTMLSSGNIVLQFLIDAVIDQNLAGVRLYIPLYIGYSLFATLVFAMSTACRNIFTATLIHDVRLSVFDGVMRRSRRDFSQNRPADYVSALTNDMNTIQGQFLGFFFISVIGILSMLFSAALMFYYQPLVAICAIFSALAMTTAPSVLGRLTGRWQKLRSERLSALTAMLSECFRGFETITTFGIQRHISKQFQECSRALRDCEYRTEGLSALSDGLAQLLSCLARTVILSLSCWMVFTGRMSVGALVVFVGLSEAFCSNLSSFLMVAPMIKGIRPILKRISGYADYTPADRQGNAEPTFQDTVSIKDLCFGYDADSPVLSHLTLTLRRGGKYALTGESGCGKSTLIRLLLGDYPDYEGAIYYDKTELRQLDRDRLSRVALCIHQDVFLFNDTIRNNICLFEEFSDEQFEWAVRASGVKKFTESLPEGTAYTAGENGERLSGGQKQRIAIARALIRNTDFLILDEGTSALDEQTALEIENALLELKDMTILTITHHLKNPQAYDAVFTL